MPLFISRTYNAPVFVSVARHYIFSLDWFATRLFVAIQERGGTTAFLGRRLTTVISGLPSLWRCGLFAAVVFRLLTSRHARVARWIRFTIFSGTICWHQHRGYRILPTIYWVTTLHDFIVFNINSFILVSLLVYLYSFLLVNFIL